MLALNVACLGLLLLALVIAAVQPAGAVRSCRDAIERARGSGNADALRGTPVAIQRTTAYEKEGL